MYWKHPPPTTRQTSQGRATLSLQPTSRMLYSATGLGSPSWACGCENNNLRQFSPLGTPCSSSTPCPATEADLSKAPLAGFPTNWLLIYCMSRVPTVCGCVHLQIDGLSARRFHIFSIQVWPVQRWCLLAGMIITGTGHCVAGPSSRRDQAGNTRDIPVVHITWTKGSGRPAALEMSINWP